MPHQCLKCGNIIKSGSSDILKGCSKCGGKKFFFINQPVSDNERQRILDRVERERESLLSKANEKFEKLIQEAQDKQLDGERLSDRDLQDMIKESWVKVDSQKQTEGQTIKAEFPDRPQGLLRPDIKYEPEKPAVKPEIAPPPEQPSPVKEVKKPEAPKVKAHPEQPTVKEAPKPPKKGKKKGEKKGGHAPKHAPKEKRKEAHKGTPVEAPKAEPQMQKFKDTLKTAKERKKALTKGGRDYPAVINVKEKGVYEIDVKALLEDSPIIVQSDGTYLLHLQSIFEKAQKKADKRKKDT